MFTVPNQSKTLLITVVLAAAIVAAVIVALGSTLLVRTITAGEFVADNVSELEAEPDPAVSAPAMTYDSHEQVEPTAATTLSSGKPTLFFFTVAANCQIRYCLQPEPAAAKLAEQYGNEVNFVPVAIYGQTTYPTADWNLYPVEPYDSWTESVLADVGLVSPHVLLVDGEGNIIYDGASNSNMAELDSILLEMAAK